MDSTAEFAQLPLRLGDQLQWRYEVIRPLVLFADRTATQRAHETATHPETVRTLHRRFRQQGMVGLLPANRLVPQYDRTKFQSPAHTPMASSSKSTLRLRKPCTKML